MTRYGPQRRFEATLEDLTHRLINHARVAHGSSKPDPDCPGCNSLLQEIEAKIKVLNKTTEK